MFFKVIRFLNGGTLMKKILTLCLIGGAFALSACAQNTGTADYSYESQAPYAAERTVGTEEIRAVRTKSAETMFNTRQRK